MATKKTAGKTKKTAKLKTLSPKAATTRMVVGGRRMQIST